jgi:hypothetical protein
MLLLAKAFWDIAIWKRTPAQLPASKFLLGLVAAAAAVLEVVGALLPPASTHRLVLRIVLSVGLPPAFAWAVLAVTRRRQRFVQTSTALLGIGVLAELVLYPMVSLSQVIGSENLASIPLEILMLIVWIGYVLACANVWRAAMDSGAMLGIAISVGCMLLTIVVEQQFLPDA